MDNIDFQIMCNVSFTETNRGRGMRLVVNQSVRLGKQPEGRACGAAQRIVIPTCLR